MYVLHFVLRSLILSPVPRRKHKYSTEAENWKLKLECWCTPQLAKQPQLRWICLVVRMRVHNDSIIRMARILVRQARPTFASSALNYTHSVGCQKMATDSSIGALHWQSEKGVDRANHKNDGINNFRAPCSECRAAPARAAALAVSAQENELGPMLEVPTPQKNMAGLTRSNRGKTHIHVARERLSGARILLGGGRRGCTHPPLWG